MKDVKKQTTLAGVKKCVQSLFDCFDARLSNIEVELHNTKLQADCEHTYLKIKIENDGWICGSKAVCSYCKKEFEVKNNTKNKENVVELHRLILEGKL